MTYGAGAPHATRLLRAALFPPGFPQNHSHPQAPHTLTVHNHAHPYHNSPHTYHTCDHSYRHCAAGLLSGGSTPKPLSEADGLAESLVRLESLLATAAAYVEDVVVRGSCSYHIT